MFYVFKIYETLVYKVPLIKTYAEELKLPAFEHLANLLKKIPHLPEKLINIIIAGPISKHAKSSNLKINFSIDLAKTYFNTSFCFEINHPFHPHMRVSTYLK